MALSLIRKFIRMESSGGILLFATAVLALALVNSPYSYVYYDILKAPFTVQIGQFGLSKPLILWVNEGLMTIFFLSVGLEIKRELISGELNSFRRFIFPAIAAVGGIIGPAAIYTCFNWGNSFAMQGWAIPTATDIAFSLGILSLLGSRVPLSLKVFLTALAIFDDLGAIIIIAAFYTHQIALPFLLFAGICLIALYILNRRNITKQEAYFFVGLILWLAVLQSGVHSTLAGVAIAFAIPIRSKSDPSHTPLRDLEVRLLPWVSFLVLPVFAFMNAGVCFAGMNARALFSAVPMGIAGGLILGKQIGIFFTSWLAIKLGIANMPSRSTYLGLYAVSVICGIGFTMSLFIGTLAFGEVGTQHAALVRFGVLAGSTVSGILGYCLLRLATSNRTPITK